VESHVRKFELMWMRVGKRCFVDAVPKRGALEFSDGSLFWDFASGV